MKTFIISLACLAVLLAGCGAAGLVVGSGRVTTETRTVSNFEALSLTGVGEVNITQGDNEGLTVEGEDNLMKYVKTEVNNGTLVISIDKSVNGVAPTKPLRFNLSVKNLKSIDLSGAGAINSAGLKGDSLTLRLSGAGSVTLNGVEAADIKSTLSGAGNLKMAGQVTNQTATLSGLGSYDAANLNSKSAHVEVSGAGGATVWATDNLDATINGVGGVNYYGSPRLNQSVKGLGGVKKVGDK